MSLTYDVWFNSGVSHVKHYQKGDNISLISVTNSDQQYYQNGNVVLYDIPSSQVVGDSVLIEINSSEQFTGYISSRTQEIRGGVKSMNYQLVGKTYDLWRYHTDDNALYSETTAYIASSLVSSYCTGVSGGGVTVTDGVDLTNDIDLTNMPVGDAIVRLSKLDGYKFYVDNDGDLQYYFPGVGIYSFAIEESDIVDMTPVEESDSDIVNDVMVIGGSDYSKVTIVSPTHPDNKKIPNGVLVAQRFEAEDPTLSAVKLYLDRSVDPNQPNELPFEIWENTETILYTDGFTTEGYLDKTRDWYNMEIRDGKLSLTYTEEIEQVTNEYDDSHPFYYWANAFMCDNSNMKTYWANMDILPSIPVGQSAEFWLEIRAHGDSQPSTTVLSSGSLGVLSYGGGWGWRSAYLRPRVELTPGTMYWLVVHSNGSKKVSHSNTNNYSAYRSWSYSSLKSDDNVNWSSYYATTRGCRFQIKLRNWKTSGLIESKSYTNDTQYMKLDIGNVTSSNKVYMSGTNSGSANWQTLTDDIWYDFGFEYNSGCRVKYKLSSNGYYTPKIDSATLRVSDDTGGFEHEVYDDSFSNYTYLSGGSSDNMVVLDGYLQISSTSYCPDNTYLYPSSVAEPTSDWTSISNTIDTDDNSYATCNMGSNPPWQYSEFYFSTNAESWSGAISHIKLKVRVRNHNTDFYMSGLSISGVGYDWIQVHGKGTFGMSHDPYGIWAEPTFALDYVYSNVKKIKLSLVENRNWGDQIVCDLAYVKFTYYPFFPSNNSIKSIDNYVGTNMESLETVPSNVTHSSYITYSGSCNSGANWLSLLPNVSTTIPSTGRHIVEWYNFTPSGMNGQYPVSSTLAAFTATSQRYTPKIDSNLLYAYFVKGGGVPKPSSKIEWSDDISWVAGDVPYPPAYSTWQSYSTPKLSGLTIGDNYWMVFEYLSNSKWWKHYYNSTSTYSGRICYSWDAGVNWSSNSTDPTDVPGGNMAFQLGWTQGDITATATNQTSIDSYGRHFKKITESNYTTLEQAQARADYEVSGMETIPMKGTLTIDGREDMSTEYRFSSNLTNFAIDTIWDIMSYTQTIDKRGFTTSINYGIHKFDIAQKIAALEVEVSA